ncbi:flagellar hook-associated protein FlgL [Clostridium neuense]|uniref:Flagellar hook-associated protein FlgL n=1 Tax=Clostridium neuense TaxID=1728934 RepID=A0ABW8TH11_9CLOT
MRVTSSMLSNNFLYDLGNNLESMSVYQRQMSSGTLINKASDDPLGASRVMQINNEMIKNKQYTTNINNANQWLSVTDTSLGQIGSVLQRINELLVSTGDPTYGDAQRQAIKEEINSNINQISQILNTTYDGKYVFGGNRGTDKPTLVTTDATSKNQQLSYASKDGVTKMPVGATPTADETNQLGMIKSKLSTEISDGVSVNYNFTASDVMEFRNDAGVSKDLRTILNNITTHLDSGDVSSLTGSDLSDIKDAIGNASGIRTEVGALENRMKSASSQNEIEISSLTQVLASTNDVDYAQVTMQYSQAQTTYLASLQTSAKILQHTLIDYL